jgi:hypothetical protein
MSESSPTAVAGWWRRPETRFLPGFTLLLAGGFAFLAWTIVVLCGVLLWIFWASRLVPRRRPAGGP